jgi:hypothetical protein
MLAVFLFCKLHSVFNSLQQLFYLLQPKPCRLQLTWGLAQYGLTEAVFQLLFFNVALVRAGQTSLNFCT